MNGIHNGGFQPVLQADQCTNRQKSFNTRRTGNEGFGPSGHSPFREEVKIYPNPKAEKSKRELHRRTEELRILLEVF